MITTVREGDGGGATAPRSASAPAPSNTTRPERPWQLQMFDRTLKKRLRLDALLRLLGALGNTRCLLVTCGDNNGAINWHLRQAGGRWMWADCHAGSLSEMSALLGEHVTHVDPRQLPYADAAFDVVVTIDVHEHVFEPALFMREVSRIVRPGGRVIITVPGGDPRKLANRLKRALGMTRERYGHVHDGFSLTELLTLLRGAGVEPGRAVTFSRFFTELIELGLNYAYVNRLGTRDVPPPAPGTIAPSSARELHAVRRSYRLYSAIYPVVRLVSRLDSVLFFTSGYVHMVEGIAGIH